MAMYVAACQSTTSGTVTATLAASAVGMDSSLTEWADTSAATANAVVQSVTGSSGATQNIDITLPGAMASASSVHLAMACEGNNGNPFYTEEAGATAIYEVRSVNGNAGLGVWWKTNDTVISATGSASTTQGWIGIEIRHDPGISLGGSITPTGSLTRLTSKTLTGSTTPTGALALLSTKVIELFGAITPAGSLTRRPV